jgi:L-Ala-D/L-Glu epimerase
VTSRDGAVLILEEEECTGSAPRSGLGETAPWPGFGLETLSSSISALQLASKYLVGLPRERYRAALEDLHRLAPVAACPCARHAVDLALHDLMAQGVGLPISKLLGGSGALEEVPVARAIPRLETGATAEAAARAVTHGFRTIKLKVGGAPPREDAARVRAVREAVGPGIAIRIDANQAWSEAEAIEALEAMRPLGLELCEQPVRAHAVESMARIRARVGVPIAADEAVRDLQTAHRLLTQGAADLLVLKPMALGGLFPARSIAMLARELGAEVLVTSLLEGPVGRTGAVHLAASLGPRRYAHGIGTPLGTGDEIRPTRAGTLRIPDRGSLSAASGPWLEIHAMEELTIGAESREEDV